MAGRMTLEELYALVPSAQDVDVAEEEHVQHLLWWLVREYVALLGPLDDDPLPGMAPSAPPPPSRRGAPDPPEDGSTAADLERDPTDAQALGCLEHLLGAELVPGDAAEPQDAGEPGDAGDAEGPATAATAPPADPEDPQDARDAGGPAG